MLKTVGRLDEGIAAYRQAIAIKPTLGEAWWSLANLKTVRFGDDDIAAMRAALGQPGLSDDDRFHLDFALGKALHDAGRFDEAFAHYAAGNALRRRYHPPRPTRSSRIVDRSIDTFTRELLAAARRLRGARPDLHRRHAARGIDPGRADPGLAQPGRRHVRASRHARDRPRQAATIRHRRGELTASEREHAGEEYLQRASVQRRTDRPFFIDKLPNNWMFVPFIHLVLPNAKIIDARRHPLGCCLSNFRQHFARGQDFTYDLADLGRYYSDYVRLMAHVDAVLPGRVHRVIYERMVDDTEARGARAARLIAGWSSSRPASPFTRPSARCARQAPSRCASRSTASATRRMAGL